MKYKDRPISKARNLVWDTMTKYSQLEKMNKEEYVNSELRKKHMVYGLLDFIVTQIDAQALADYQKMRRYGKL